MEWATDIGKSCVLAPPTCQRTFTLAGKPIKTVESTKYPGVIVDFNGVIHADTKSRVKAANATAQTLAETGVLREVYLPRRIHLYKTFIRPKFKFGIHLAPWNPTYLTESNKLEREFLKHPTFNATDRTCARYQGAIGIDNMETRRNKLGRALVARLQGHIANGIYKTPEELCLAQLELQEALALFSEVQLTEPDKNQRQTYKRIESKIPERRGCPENSSVPIMKLPGPFIRMATLWYFSLFPCFSTKNRIPQYSQRNRTVKNIMRKESWTAEERQHIIDEFTVYAKHTDYNYDYLA